MTDASDASPSSNSGHDCSMHVMYSCAATCFYNAEMNIANCRLMGLALRPQLPPLDVKSVIIII